MPEVRPDEVSAILRKQLAGFEKEVDMYDVGTVLQVGDGVARVYGLSKALMSELVEFPHGVFGMVLNLEEDNVGCILFGESSGVKEGDTVKRTGRVASMPVGEQMLGRVVNPLGQPVDGRGPITTEKLLPIERKALGVIERCFKPLDEWRRVADDVRGSALPGGHYLPEEVPELVATELERFFLE